MKSLLHTLNDNEAVLLMYLFNELPADDRAEVEEMLAFDGGLRCELEQLKAMHQTIDGALEVADARVASPRAEAAVRRQAYKAIDQWDTRQHALVAPIPIKPRSLLRLVLYSSGIAAAILVGFSYIWVMSSHSDLSLIGPGPLVSAGDEEQLINTLTDANSPENSTELSDAQSIEASDLLRKSLDTSEELMRDSITHIDLAAAEQEIQTVVQLSDVRSINGEMDMVNDLMQ